MSLILPAIDLNHASASGSSRSSDSCPICPPMKCWATCFHCSTSSRSEDEPFVSTSAFAPLRSTRTCTLTLPEALVFTLQNTPEKYHGSPRSKIEWVEDHTHPIQYVVRSERTGENWKRSSICPSGFRVGQWFPIQWVGQCIREETPSLRLDRNSMENAYRV